MSDHRDDDFSPIPAYQPPRAFEIPFLRHAPTGPRQPGGQGPWPRRLLIAGAALLALLALAFGGFVWRLSALQARRAVGPSWSFPSRVYSEGVSFQVGSVCPPEYVQAQLDARGYRFSAQALRQPGTYAWHDETLDVLLRGFLDARDPEGFGGPERVLLRFANGRIVGLSRLGGPEGAAPPDTSRPPRLEPVRLAVIQDSKQVMRSWVPLARMPRALRDAVVASEDRRFYHHHGIDPHGGLRAVLVNLRAGGVREGASTITQQLARGLFLGNRRTLGRKLQEMGHALLLEAVLPKDRILEMYLNSVYFGRDAHGGIAGVEEASQRFFGVSVDRLTLGQAAMLVGVIPAPNAFSPLRRPAAALKRRHVVLGDMLATGAIDSASAARADTEPAHIRPRRVEQDRATGFITWLRQDVGRQLPRHALEGWGLTLFTTLDAGWQQIAEQELPRTLEAEDPRGRRGPLQGAFVMIEAATGRVRAMVGGRDPQRGDFDRAFQARRQPGSSIKPIVYAAAVDPRRVGPVFTPASVVADVPRTFRTDAGPWTPHNSSGQYHERISLVRALAMSQNVATANLVDSLGPAIVARAIERFGLGRPPAVLSLGLGTFEVSPLALTSAYSTFANQGVRADPTPLRAIVDGTQRTMRIPSRQRTRLLDPQTNAVMVGMIREVVRSGISHPLVAGYGFHWPVGGKTGTTNDNRDAWWCGVTPALAAGVWVGYDAPRPLPRAAAGMALPVWANIMNRVLDGFPETEFPVPEGVQLVKIDTYTGGVAKVGCSGVLSVLMRSDRLPPLCTSTHARERFQLMLQALMDSLTTAEGDTDLDAAGGAAPALPDTIPEP